MNKPIFILAQSYPHVKSVLYLIDSHRDNNVEIHLLIFQNKYLFEFFNHMNKEHFNDDINIEFIPKYSVGNDEIYFKYNLLAEKKFLRKQFNKYCHQTRNHLIYFFSKSFTDYGYYFLKNLYKNNDVIHIQDPGCDVYDIRDGKPNNIKSMLQLIYAKLLLGRHIVLGDTGRKRYKIFFTISEKFYNNIIDQKVLKEERDELQKNFSLSKYSIKKYSRLQAIYFDKDVVKDKLCDDFTYQKELEGIFNVVLEFIPSDSIGRKYKPNRTSDYNKKRIDVGEIIPDYIPAELIYNDNIEVYLGMTSIALANIERGNVISLVYLISFLNPENREGSVYNQEKRKKGNKIHYPRTLDELRSCLDKLIK